MGTLRDRTFAKILLILARNQLRSACVRYMYIYICIDDVQTQPFHPGHLFPSSLPRACWTNHSSIPCIIIPLARKRSCSCWSTVCHDGPNLGPRRGGGDCLTTPTTCPGEEEHVLQLRGSCNRNDDTGDGTGLFPRC